MKKTKRLKILWQGLAIATLTLLFNLQAFGQALTITGKVTDQDGISLPGAYVRIQGTQTGTATGADGNYSINVNSGATLVFSFIGYEDQEQVVGASRVINVVMIESAEMLEEVIVTGYQVQRKVDLTGSISVAKIDDIKDLPSGSALQSLQGRIPGAYITSSGSPTGGASILIRGYNTLGSSNPLYIIDGVPTTSASAFNNLDPFSIESIQVLKDASAASIYGSRASNGVVIITTKAGSESISITVNSSITSQWHLRRLEMCNTQELGRLLWQGSINDNSNPSVHSALYTYEWHTDANDIAVLDKVTPVEWIGGNESFKTKSADTDWQDEVFRTGLISTTGITITSGSERNTLLVGLSYYKNKGLVILNDFDRIRGRINSSYNFFNKRLKIGENLQLSRTKERPVPSDLGGASLISLATTIMPILPVYTTDDKFSGPIGAGFSDRNNPVHIAEINKDDYNSDVQLFGNLFIELTPIKNLLFRSNFGLEYNTSYDVNIERAFQTGFLGRTLNSLNNSSSRSANWTWSNTMNYELDFNRHSTTFLLGMEAIKRESISLSGRREQFALEDVNYYYLDSGTGNSSNSGSASGNQLLSYFGKVNYNFGDKYLASATIRRDGSSRFGEENIFGWFPSASIGWIISKENFIANNLSFVSLIKLRAGLGRVGNQEIGNDARFTMYETSYDNTSYDITGADSGTLPSGFVATRTGNPKLKWETTEEINIGVDFGFLNQRITASVDYFIRETKDILISPPYPGVIGEGGSQYVNGATMENNGYEIELGYKSNIGDISYNIAASISHFYDKITYLPESVVRSYAGNVEKTILGHSRSSVFGYVTDGLFQTQEEVDAHVTQAGKGVGRIRYKDLNGDGKIDPLDQDWLGTSLPDISYGINVMISYKNISLTMFMQGLQGISVNDGSKSTTDFMGTILGVNKGTRLLDAWTPQNTDATVPAVSLTNSNNETRGSDYFRVNGSYFKLSNIQLSYALPTNLISRIRLSQLRVYILGENVILIKDNKGKNAFTGPDPETPGSTYPKPVRLTLGLDFKF